MTTRAQLTRRRKWQMLTRPLRQAMQPWLVPNLNPEPSAGVRLWLRMWAQHLLSQPLPEPHPNPVATWKQPFPTPSRPMELQVTTFLLPKNPPVIRLLNP